MRKIITAAEGVFFTLVILVLLAWGALRLFGYTPYVVLSGSMEPACPVGSLVVVHPEDPDLLQEGDVITFQTEDKVITHRIHAILPQGFQTKSDANEFPDGNPVAKEQVIGSLAFCIPRLGYGVSFLASKPGMLVCLAVFFGFVCIEQLMKAFDGSKPPEQAKSAAA